MSAPARAAVLGHVGHGNLGDEALVAATVAGLRARAPNLEIVGLVLHPDDGRIRHGIATFPLRRPLPAPVPGTGGEVGATSAPRERTDPLRRVLARVPFLYRVARVLARLARGARATASECAFLVASFRRLRGVRLLVVAGSQQLNDVWGGPWGFPYTLWKWTVLARLRGARVALLGVGVGPLETRWGRRLIAGTVRRAAVRSYRDRGSRDLAATVARRPPTDPIVPDLAFGLAPPARADRPPGPLRVALNPMPYGHGGYWYRGDERAYAGYIEAMAALADGVVARGHALRLYPTQLTVDPLAIADVRARMRSPTGVEVAEVRGVGDVLAVVASADVVIATRYHGIVLALLAGTPVLGIAYHPKSRELLASLGLEAWVVDADAADGPRLARTFDALVARRHEVAATLAERVPALRGQLDEEWRRVLGLLNGGAP